MQAGRVLLGSAVLHAGAFAVFAWWLDPPPTLVVAIPPPPIDVTIVPRAVDPTVDPTDIVILEPVAALTTMAGTTRTTRTTHTATVSPGSAAIASAPTGGTTETTAGDHPGGRGRGIMHMRGPELHPGDAQLEAIANSGAPLAAKAHETGRVEDAPNGKAVIHDLVTTIEVEKDGTAHLHDDPDIDVHWKTPVHLFHWRQDLRDAGEVIAEWAKDPEASKRYGRPQDLPRHLQAAEGGCASFGDFMCDDPEAPPADKRMRDNGSLRNGIVPIFGGKLDVTGWLAKKFGVGDVYASRKLKALDDTRDERVARGDKFRTHELARSAELMHKNLVALWAATQDVDERRAVLFELWDECAEGDGAVGEAGERARLEVIGWIRAKLPADHPGAFSPADLDVLDKRRASTQHFAPY